MKNPKKMRTQASNIGDLLVPWGKKKIASLPKPGPVVQRFALPELVTERPPRPLMTFQSLVTYV